jgi:hypothetical protein
MFSTGLPSGAFRKRDHEVLEAGVGGLVPEPTLASVVAVDGTSFVR